MPGSLYAAGHSVDDAAVSGGEQPGVPGGAGLQAPSERRQQVLQHQETKGPCPTGVVPLHMTTAARSKVCTSVMLL